MRAANEETNLLHVPDQRRRSSILSSLRSGARLGGSSLVLDLGEEGGEVQTVEQFSDLVVVAAIHAISDALADKEHAVTMKDWIWFFTHVFFLWYVWFGVCFFANIAHMFTVAGKFECIHYVIILASMAVIVTMVKAVSSEKHKLAIGMAFAGRLLLETCILCEIFCRRAPWVEPDKKKLHKDLAVRILVQVSIEMLPFVVVGHVFSDTFHDIFPFSGSLGTMVITAINMRAVAFQLVKHSQLSERDHTDIADLGHLEERYEIDCVDIPW